MLAPTMGDPSVLIDLNGSLWGGTRVDVATWSSNAVDGSIAKRPEANRAFSTESELGGTTMGSALLATSILGHASTLLHGEKHGE